MHLNDNRMMFKRILTLVFLIVSLFVPNKNSEESFTPDKLTIVDPNNLFENPNLFKDKKDDKNSQVITSVSR